MIAVARKRGRCPLLICAILLVSRRELDQRKTVHARQADAFGEDRLSIG
jgi:hypothetical protein